MKAIRRILIIVMICNQFSMQLYAQKELVISGGNVVSSYVCDNNRAYAWGSNKNTVGTGILGVGSTAVYESSPKVIQYFVTNNITIQQINSGSGAHFVALDCNKNVWSWGDNMYGQVGNNTSGNNVTTPTKVKAGVLVGTHWDDGAGNLTNVKIVYAGSNSSFAILDNGELVSWGLNTYDNNSANDYTDAVGQLGDGTTISRLTPVYVKINATTHLSGVKQIFVGDVVAYALVDPDDDGVGTVYSWGNGLNGTLGRNAAGTGNPSSDATVQSSYALPVFYVNNTPMNNITTISAGDVFGIALDVDGYIWTWGNGGWNNATGNTTTNYKGSDPRRVLKGATTGSDDGTYLFAKAIGGGQGYGMAVTIDGKPVAWGGGGCAAGGTTGNGTLTGSASGTQYIKYSATGIHNDVILINRGDTWGFYGRSDGTMWTWGCNESGQLGIGNVTSQSYATLITPPSGCNAKLPPPNVTLSPNSMTVCETAFLTSGGVTINSGFVIAPALFSNYKIRWYKNGTIVKQANPITAITDLTYNATTIGTYSVEIEIISATCSSYEIAKAQMTISAYPVTFTAPTTLTYCGVNADVNVNSTATTNSLYTWYPSLLSSTELGISKGSNTVEIDVSSVTTNTGSPNTKIVYVEEKSAASGIVLKKAEGCDATWFADSKDMNNTYQSSFTITESVTIDSLTVPVLLKAYDNNQPNVSGTINFGIYGSKVNSGGDVAADANLISTFSVNVSGTRTASSSDIKKEYSVIVNKTISNPGKYFIAPLKTGAMSGFVGNGTIMLGTGNCGQAVPKVDDVTGTIIQFDGVSTSFANPQTGGNIRQGHFYNIYFKTGQRYCDRKPVTLKESCPCNTPLDITISSTDIDGYLCPTGTTTLTTTPVQVNTTDFDFEWFKGAISSASISTATSLGAATGGIAQTSKIVNSGGVGTYYVRIRDKNMPAISSCYKEASIKIYDVPKPTYTITGNGSYCPESASKTPVVITFATGTAPFTFDEAVTGTGKTSPTATYTINNPVAGTYKPTNITDTYGCIADISSSSVTVQDLTTPALAISSIPSLCQGALSTINVSSYVTSDLVPLTYSTSKGTINASGLLTLAGAGLYTITVEATGTIAPNCKNTKTVALDVWSLPTASITAPPATMCKDGLPYTLIATPTPVLPATGVFSGAVSTSTFDPTTAVVGANTITYTYTDSHGCVDDATATITVVKVDPPTVTAPNPKVIVVAVDNSFSEPATVAATGTNTIQWMDATCNSLVLAANTYNPGLTVADLGALQEKTFTYKVRQKDIPSGCVSTCVDAIIDITRCPFTIPTVTGAEKCQFEALPSISALTSSTVDSWKWYQADRVTAIPNNSSTYNHSVSNATAGTTNFYVSYIATDAGSGNQCESPKALVTVIVNPKPATPITTDAEMCEGTAVLPLKSDNVIDKWYSDNAALVYTGTQGKNFTPTGVTNTNVTYYVRRDISGCLSDIASATLSIIGKPTFSITGPDKEKCITAVAESIQTGNYIPAMQSDDFFTWTISPNSGGAVSQTTSTFNPSTYLTTATTYTINAVYNVKLATQTCPSDVQTIHYVVHPPAPKPEVTSSTICQGDAIAPIEAVGTDKITWTSKNGLPSFVGRNYDFTALGVNDLEVGIYSFDLQDESEYGCLSEVKTVSLEIAQGAVTNLIGDSLICVNTIGQLYTLDFIPTKASQYTWEVTGNNNHYLKDVKTPAIHYVDWKQSGVYTITVTEKTWAGCEASDSKVIYVADKPNPNFSWSLPGDGTIVWFKDSTTQPPIVEITPSGNVEIPIKYTMFWDFGQTSFIDNVDAEVSYENRHSIVEASGYGFGNHYPILTVENEYGCRAEYTRKIFIDLKTGIYVPSAFAPTNQAYGVRYFQPVGFNIKECEIWVFDKWGNIVWYSNDVKDGLFVGKWDGTYNGDLLQSDVYIWRIKATLLDGKVWKGEENDRGKYKKRGSVYLIR